MKKLFLFLCLVSCSSFNSNYDVTNENFNFNQDLTFNEFNELLIKYDQISPYPDIDE